MYFRQNYIPDPLSLTQATELLLKDTQQQTVQIRLEKIMNSETTPTIARLRELLKTLPYCCRSTTYKFPDICWTHLEKVDENQL